MAALTIQFTRRARTDLNEILGFIAQDNPKAASDLSERIEKGLARVALFPASARHIPEALERPERDLVVPPVRIFYRVENQVLLVMMMIRSERDFHPDELGSESQDVRSKP